MFILLSELRLCGFERALLGWWDGVVWGGRERNWFPSNYVRRISDEEAERLCGSKEEPLQATAHGNVGANGVVDTFDHDHEVWAFGGNAPLGPASSEDSRPSRSSTHEEWADWVPRVTEDGQIFYYNTQTGQRSTEMPSAEADPVASNGAMFNEAERDSPQFANPPPGSSTPSTEDNSDTFFDEHGFGRDLLVREGIMPASSAFFFRDSVLPASDLSGSTQGSMDEASVHTSAADLLRDSLLPAQLSSTAVLAALHGNEDSLSESSGRSYLHPRTHRAPTVTQDGSDWRGLASSDVEERFGRPALSRVEDCEERILASIRALRQCLAADFSGNSARWCPVPAVAARTRHLIAEIRSLLHMTGQIDALSSTYYPAAAHLGEGGYDNAAALATTNFSSDVASLRAPTKRVTTELSKLVASIRAIWSLMAVEDNHRVQPRHQGLDTIQLLQHEDHLRRNCLSSLDSLSVRLSDFLRQMASPAVSGAILHRNGHLRASTQGALSTQFRQLLGHFPLESPMMLDMAADRLAPAALPNFLVQVRDELEIGANRLVRTAQHALDCCENLDRLANSNYHSNELDGAGKEARPDGGLVGTHQAVEPSSSVMVYKDLLHFGRRLVQLASIMAGEIDAVGRLLLQLVELADEAGSRSAPEQTSHHKAADLEAAEDVARSLRQGCVGAKLAATRIVLALQIMETDGASDLDNVALLTAPALVGYHSDLATENNRFHSHVTAVLQSTWIVHDILGSDGSEGRGFDFGNSREGRLPVASEGSRTSTVSEDSFVLGFLQHDAAAKRRSTAAGTSKQSPHLTPGRESEAKESPDLAAFEIDGRIQSSPTFTHDDRSEGSSGAADIAEVDRTNTSPLRSNKLARFFGEDTSLQSPVSPVTTGEERPGFLGPDYTADDISFTSENQIKGGTLKGLVVKLTSHEGPDVQYLRTFLMTYRTFTTSTEFLELLVQRYHLHPPTGLSVEDFRIWDEKKRKLVQIRVVNVMRTWIESYLSDNDDEDILDKVVDFTTYHLSDAAIARQLLGACERRRANRGPKKMPPLTAPGNPPTSILPRNMRKLKFLDVDPLEMARQLTLFDSQLFKRIEVNECLGKAWPKEFSSEGSPNIKSMIDMSNAITRWVAETILVQTDPKKRANTIKHFIVIAERCRSLNNFSTLMQIIAGLNSTPIHRLRRTWESVTQRHMLSLGHLNNTMSPTKNYAAYREMVRNMTPPCVPFLGVYLTDWTFIGDGNPDTLREKPQHINFNKRQKAAELIVQIQSYQSMPYQLAPVPAIVKFIDDQIESQREEGDLFSLSLELEPREREDEKIARLLAESGFL